MCRLFLCIPIFRVFLLKSVKKCVFVVGVKSALLLVKNVFINVREGISKLGTLGSNKTHFFDSSQPWGNNRPLSEN